MDITDSNGDDCIYTILWYYFPNTVVIEKKVYVYPVEELVCGKKEKIVEYIASDCTPHTK